MRLEKTYEPVSDNTVTTNEDIVKILTVFSEYKKLSPSLIEGLIDYISSNMIFFDLNMYADLTAIFCMSTPKSVCDQFLNLAQDKIVANIKYCNDKLYFRFLYCFMKAKVDDMATIDNFALAFMSNHADFSNKLFLRSLVLLNNAENLSIKSKMYSEVEDDLSHRFK